MYTAQQNQISIGVQLADWKLRLISRAILLPRVDVAFITDNRLTIVWRRFHDQLRSAKRAAAS